MPTYTPYSIPGDVVTSVDTVSTSTWSNNVNNLQTAFTSSTQAVFGSPTSSGAFRIDVYNADLSATNEEIQYSVLYGHKGGSGSLNYTNDTGSFGLSPSRAVYSQYRSLVHGVNTTNFTFGNTTPDEIFVININRSRYRQNLKPGTLNLKLKGDPTKDEIILTDNSVTVTGSATLTEIGREFYIVSGTNGTMLGSSVNQTSYGAYGLFYPDAGFMVFNATAISHSIGLELDRSKNTDAKNHQKFYNAISSSGYFILDSEEKIASEYYFTRVKNGDFNYTTNDTFIDSSGNLRFDSMIDNPRVYITTVGLYNDQNDLVAVAKLSQPLAKDFTKEALIKVKLDY